MSLFVTLPWNTQVTLLHLRACQAWGHLCSAAPQSSTEKILPRAVNAVSAHGVFSLAPQCFLKAEYRVYSYKTDKNLTP